MSAASTSTATVVEPAPKTLNEILADLEVRYKAAEARRAKGNEFFKGGDYRKALAEYHLALFEIHAISITLDQTVNKPTVSGMPKEHPLLTNCKNALNSLYCNMSAAQVKQENWKKALYYAEEAKKVTAEKPNKKASFREAQARIKLGEPIRGRKMLEDLLKDGKDAAIEAAVRELDISDKARANTTGKK